MHVIERVSGVSAVRADALERAQRALTRGWVDILVFTSADLVVEWVSPSVHDVGGWHPDELIGRTALSLIHPDDVATVVETMGGVIDAGLVYDPLGETPLDPADSPPPRCASPAGTAPGSPWRAAGTRCSGSTGWMACCSRSATSPIERRSTSCCTQSRAVLR